MTIEPGTTMREWEKREQERRGTNAAEPLIEVGVQTTHEAALIAVLERIATALEKIASKP